MKKTTAYASENQMKFNTKKCKFMVFNPTVNYDFVPELEIEGKVQDTVEEMKLLGLVVRNDLKWKSNTNEIVSKGYKKL